MSHYKPYLAYKDSGVEWLGEVPAHWEVKRLKHCLRLAMEKTSRRGCPVALENVEGWSGRFIETASDFEGEGVAFVPGDILFGKLRPYLAKAYLAEFNGEAIGDFHVLRPGSSITGRFAQYQILNRDFIAIADSSTFGAKMPRVSWEFMGNMAFLLPPGAEQTAIAAFLDRETAKLDTLIAKQEKLIELLQEKRQALISHAVTKGLNPDAPMKDSGVAWLGEVPGHWEVTALKRCFRVIGGSTPKSDLEAYWDGSIIWVTPADLSKLWTFEISDSQRKITAEGLASCGTTLVPVGSIVLSTRAPIGSLAIADRELCTNQGCKALVPTEHIYSRFYAYLLSTATEELNIRGKGTTFLEISGDELGRLSVVLPSITEQTAIAAFLDRETAKLDTLIEKSRRSIELMREHRTALISAAVTGKIDVREAA